jgi:YggT family protein
MNSLILLIYEILKIYIFVLLASVIMSWLIYFNVINTRNRFVYMVVDVLNRLTEPVLRPVRRFLPNLGGLDLSVLVVLLLIWFAQNLLLEYGLGMPFAVH